MPTKWQTYPMEFKGGLITNMSPLQQGINSPGSARTLRNFEPSIEGGYRRILGFDKYDSAIIPPYGAPVVNAASQSGTTLILSSIHTTPVAGDTFTIAGVSGTYTIASGGVSYVAATNTVTLTLSTSLASSPANGAAITFATTTTSYLAHGLGVFIDRVIVAKNNDLFTTAGSGYTKINIPSYGTVLVNAGSQSGATLAVDALTAAPKLGDVFTVAGIDKVYTVTANATVASGGSTLAISPNLASSPADNAAVTFISTAREGATKTRFCRYNYTGTEKIAIVDGFNYPALWDNTTFTILHSAPSDVLASKFVETFKNQLFFAKGSTLTFTAPYTDSDFTAASGAGSLSIGAEITGIITFREQLVIFTETSIFQLVGNTSSDFQLKPVTRDIGCIDTDTIQEVGGDIMFLGPDGLRLLGGTDRIGDYGLGVVSKNIQNQVTDLITSSTSFSSVVIRGKSQYRLLGFSTNITEENAQGVLGTQFSAQGGEDISWAETRGIRSYVADSRFYNNVETIVFANDDGYLYQMEEGNSFDGANIKTTFATPFVPISDPRTRKTFYKAFLYTDPQGSVSFEMSLKLDFDQKDVIQPTQIDFNNATGTVAFFGAATYGSTAVFSGKLLKLFSTQLIGSGFTASFQFQSDSTDPPFSLDAITIEYGINTRR
tara:strand:+ start:432 stop:2414 length:1983 start_codon:yes stop_codon:yes gene_type:complete